MKRTNRKTENEGEGARRAARSTAKRPITGEQPGRRVSDERNDPAVQPGARKGQRP